MTILVLAALCVVTALFAYQMHQKVKVLSGDERAKEVESLRMQLEQAHEALRDLRERSGDKFVKMTNEELSGLAKTGCNECFGAGYRKRDAANAVCPCVIKRMRGDPKYGVTPEGDPVRMATKDEVLAYNAALQGGAQC